MASKKEKTTGDLLTSFIDFNNSSVLCDCSPVERTLFGCFTMAEISRKSRHFLNRFVFAVEYRRQGSRLFFATSIRHASHYFFALRSSKNVPELTELTTWHEILLGDQPIRLYLDIEFYKEPQLNPIDETAALERLWQALQFHLESKDVEKEELCKFETDATTDQKLSRHWVLHGTQFPTTVEAGDCVRDFLATLSKEVPFWVENKTGAKKKQLWIVDDSVYNAGQNFRMVGSPKFGRENTLLPLIAPKDHQFAFHSDCEVCIRAFESSLVTLPSPDNEELWLDLYDAIAKGKISPNTYSLRTVSEAADFLWDLAKVVDKHLKQVFPLLNDFRTFFGMKQSLEDKGAQFVTLLDEFRNLLLEGSTERLQCQFADILELLEDCNAEGKKLWEAAGGADASEAEASIVPLTSRQTKALTVLERNLDTKMDYERYTGLVKLLPAQLRSTLPTDFNQKAIRDRLKALEIDADSKTARRFSRRQEMVSRQIQIALREVFCSDLTGETVGRVRTSASGQICLLLDRHGHRKVKQALEITGIDAELRKAALESKADVLDALCVESHRNAVCAVIAILR